MFVIPIKMHFADCKVAWSVMYTKSTFANIKLVPIIFHLVLNLPSVGRKPYVGDFHKTKMFRRSEKTIFCHRSHWFIIFWKENIPACSGWGAWFNEHALVPFHLEFKKLFWKNVFPCEFMHVRVHACTKTVCWQKAVSYDNCQRVGQEESRVSIFHLFTGKKPYVEFSFIYLPVKRTLVEISCIFKKVRQRLDLSHCVVGKCDFEIEQYLLEVQEYNK